MRAKLILPFPPSVNTYWHNRVIQSKRGKPFVSTYLSKKGKQYKENVTAAAIDQRLFNKKIDLPIKVTVHLYPPDRKTRDIDNYMKGLLDALGYAKVYVDDSQIDILHIVRKQVDKPGRAEVWIETIEARGQLEMGWDEE